MLKIADRVKEATTSTGTGAVALAGATTGYRAFSSVCSDQDTVYYGLQAVDSNGKSTGDWEVGLGTYNSSGNTLSRTTIFASSNSNAAVNLTSGTKQVFITQPAERVNDPHGMMFAKPPKASSFTLTADSEASAAITDLASGRGCVLTNTTVNSSTDAISCAGVPVSGTWQITAMLAAQAGLAADYGCWGLYVRDTAGAVSGKIAEFGPVGSNIQAYPGGGYSKWSGFPSAPAYSARSLFAGGMPTVGPIWLRLKWDGTNYTFYTSADGESFVSVFSIAGGDYISAPAEAGIVLDSTVGVGFNVAVTIFSFEKV